MKFSEQWLRDWVNPPNSTADLAHQLTMAGLEVDALEPVAPYFTGVVVGRVLLVEPHPNAERLTYCKVDTGGAAPLLIVCGAANVAAGITVPVARVGAKLPGGLAIKKTKLRGVESEGMLCSAKELGLAETSDGLMILPSDAALGTDVRECLQLNDVSISLGLTPNRGDCLSIAGIAREVAVLNRALIKLPEISPVAATVADTFDISVEQVEACPRYLGRIIKDVDAKAKSPLWMQERLRRSGVRSISAVVDVSNYVMLELGQPMHAFDLAKLSGSIRVRWATAGERILLLDGEEVGLDGETLVIADQRGPIALAGVMGGSATAVSDETHAVMLECAFFSPKAVSGRARRYGRHTDSSHRFERGVDPDLPRRAMERATALLIHIAGGEPGPVTECASLDHLPVRRPIRLRAERLRRILGMDIAAEDITRMLTALGMQVILHDEAWEVTAPSFRFDINIEADVIEELARIHGYSALPTRLSKAGVTIKTLPATRVEESRSRHVLVDRGYQEAITYSFVDPVLQQRIAPDIPTIALNNPISADMAVMRTSLWPGLLAAVTYNQNRQQGRVRLFELGARYLRDGAGIIEDKMLAGVATGSAYPEQWGVAQRGLDFFDVKADLEALLNPGKEGLRYIYTSDRHPALHPGQTARITTADGGLVGWLGAIHPGLAHDLDIKTPVMLFEIQLAVSEQGRLPKYRELSKFPAIRRDIAVVIDEQVPARAVEDCIVREVGDLLQSLQLFDVYQGKGIDSGKKSLALGLTLQESSRTLTDQEVEAVIGRAVTALNKQFGATLRE